MDDGVDDGRPRTSRHCFGFHRGFCRGLRAGRGLRLGGGRDDAAAAIMVVGNHRAGADAIRAHFHRGPDGKLDAAARDAALKSLYATGLFQDVKFAHDGDHIVVTVVENPTIERIAFEGNKKIKDEDLKKAMQSKPPAARYRGLSSSRTSSASSTSIASTAISRPASCQDDRGQETRGPKTGPKTGRTDLVFEIKEGDKLAVRKSRSPATPPSPRQKLKGEIKTGETNR